MSTDGTTARWLGPLAAAWGVLGVVALLLRAIVSLTPIALDALLSPLTLVQWVALAAWVGFMAYTEGYRGFQRKFSPFVGARVHELIARPTLLRAVLAPAFCMGLFDATRRRLLVSWGLLIGVIGLVLVIRLLDQPWRGIIDAGVVVGLSWGALSLLAAVGRAVLTGHPVADAELAARDNAAPSV